MTRYIQSSNNSILIEYVWSDNSDTRELSESEETEIVIGILLGNNHGSVIRKYLAEYDENMDTCVTEYTISCEWKILNMEDN